MQPGRAGGQHERRRRVIGLDVVAPGPARGQVRYPPQELVAPVGAAIEQVGQPRPAGPADHGAEVLELELEAQLGRAPPVRVVTVARTGAPDGAQEHRPGPTGSMLAPSNTAPGVSRDH